MLKKTRNTLTHLQDEVVRRAASARHPEQEVLLEAVVPLAAAAAAADAAGPRDARHAEPGTAVVPRFDGSQPR